MLLAWCGTVHQPAVVTSVDDSDSYAKPVPVSKSVPEPVPESSFCAHPRPRRASLS